MKEYIGQLNYIRDAIDSGLTSIPAIMAEMQIRGFTILSAEDRKRDRENVALIERMSCRKSGDCQIKNM